MWTRHAVLAKVKEFYGNIPKKSLPPRPEINLQPVKPESFTLDSNLPYLLAFVAFRMPGTDSPDFAAAQILGDVLSSQRGNLYAMVPQGKALQTEFGFAEAYREGQRGVLRCGFARRRKRPPVIAEMRKILADYAANGVPAELVEAAKRREISGAEFRRNSIPGLAAEWSDALAAEGRNSPDDDVEAMKRVTLADVNRVAKQYLVDQNSITAELKPVPSGEAVASKGFGGGEQLTSAPTKPVDLPSWAGSRLLTVELPASPPPSADMTLSNGMRLIVRTLKITPTITVLGKHPSRAPSRNGAGQGRGQRRARRSVFLRH